MNNRLSIEIVEEKINILRDLQERINGNKGPKLNNEEMLVMFDILDFFDELIENGEISSLDELDEQLTTEPLLLPHMSVGETDESLECDGVFISSIRPIQSERAKITSFNIKEEKRKLLENAHSHIEELELTKKKLQEKQLELQHDIKICNEIIDEIKQEIKSIENECKK